MNNSLSLPNILKVSQHGPVDLYYNSVSGERLIHTAVSFKAEDVICVFKAAANLKEPSKYTVQMGDDEHIILQPEYLQYVNHSCCPNTFFDTSLLLLVALQSIEPGDELTFFYPSAEWDMAEPFTCFCGNQNCLHTIQGAKYLDREVFSTYRATAFIRNKFDKINT